MVKPVWIKDGKRVIKQVQNENLKFQPAYNEDSGVYVCEGTYPNGKSFSTSAELWVACKSQYYNIVIGTYGCELIKTRGRNYPTS